MSSLTSGARPGRRALLSVISFPPFGIYWIFRPISAVGVKIRLLISQFTSIGSEGKEPFISYDRNRNTGRGKRQSAIARPARRRRNPAVHVSPPNALQAMRLKMPLEPILQPFHAALLISSLWCVRLQSPLSRFSGRKTDSDEISRCPISIPILRRASSLLLLISVWSALDLDKAHRRLSPAFPALSAASFSRPREAVYSNGFDGELEVTCDVYGVRVIRILFLL